MRNRLLAPRAYGQTLSVEYGGICGADAWGPFCDSRPMPQISLGAQVRFSALRS